MRSKGYNVFLKSFFDIYEKSEVLMGNVEYFCALQKLLISYQKMLCKELQEARTLFLFMDVKNPYDYVVEYSIFNMKKEPAASSVSNFKRAINIVRFIESRLCELTTYVTEKKCRNQCTYLNFAKVKTKAGEFLLLECPICGCAENLDGTKYAGGFGEEILATRKEIKDAVEKNPEIVIMCW